MNGQNYKTIFFGICMLSCTVVCYANKDVAVDSLISNKLDGVVVLPQQQYNTTQKSAYIPSPQAKKSSQTGIDLLGRMGIPQIQVDCLSQTVQAAGGGEVGIFINFIPCTDSELALMLVADVVRVDYYEHPSDPRFQGQTKVINFITKKRDYGGYAKANADVSMLVNNEYVKGIARNQYKKMTYDLMGVYRQNFSNHNGTVSNELFDIGEQHFNRNSTFTDAKYRQRYCQTETRALYDSDNVIADNKLSVGIENTPHDDCIGTVLYNNITKPTSSYSSNKNSRNGFFAYNGYYYFKFSDVFSLTSKLGYTYSKTKESSNYIEENSTAISNKADDTSQDFDGTLLSNFDMKSSGQIDVHERTLYSKSKTDYSGSASAFDSADILYNQIGAAYSLSLNQIYGRLGIGYTWIKSTMNAKKASSSTPYADLFVQYSPNNQHSLSLEFHYSEWTPSANLKSEITMQISPYIWHTGNPYIEAYKSYDLGLFYTFLHSDAWNFTAFSDLWATKDRYAYVYIPMTEQIGILRTLQQPMGLYMRERVGLNGNVKLFKGSLTLNGNILQTFIQNKSPYYSNLSRLTFGLGLNLYINDFDLSVSYQSSDSFSESNIYLTTVKTKDNYNLSIGWAKLGWNIRMRFNNLFRWNWANQIKTSNYEYYNNQETVYNSNSHANLSLSVTYSFNFGKRVNQDNESQEQNLSSSGILH